MKTHVWRSWFAKIIKDYLGIDLSEYWPMIEKVGKQQNEINIKKGRFNRKVGPQGNEEINIMGKAGEVAVRLALGLPLDPVWKVQKTGKYPEIDGEYKGETFQVKTPVGADRRMLFNPAIMTLKAQLYFLVVPAGSQRVRIVGWLPRDMLKKRMEKTNLGWGEVYIIEQRFFWPLHKLLTKGGD